MLFNKFYISVPTYVLKSYLLLSKNGVVEAYLLKCLNRILVLKTLKAYCYSRKYVFGKCIVAQGQRLSPAFSLKWIWKRQF